MRRLFVSAVLDDVVSTDRKTGKPMVDGKPIGPTELKSLQAEAKALGGFRIWQLMSKTTKRLAEKKIFEQSVTLEDITFGKAMLYNLSLQESILNAFREK